VCQSPEHAAKVCPKNKREQKPYTPYRQNNRNWEGARDIRKPFGAGRKQISAMTIDLCEVTVQYDKKGDLREYISTAIGNGTPIRSLCDPGPQDNGIAASTLAEHGMSDMIDESAKIKARMADDSVVDTLGCIDIDCEIEGSKKKVRFAVIDKLNPAIIFGTPFLQETGVLSDFRQSIDAKIRKSKN